MCQITPVCWYVLHFVRVLCSLIIISTFFYLNKLKGASPVEIDLGRGLRADQWARFVGRHTCAEMIEQYSRTRLMDRNTPSKWSHDVVDRGNSMSRAKTFAMVMDTNSNTQGFYSKFLKALPFKFAREKNRFDTSSNNNNNNSSNNNMYTNSNAKEDQPSNNNGMVNYLGTSALLCSVGVAVPTGGNVSRKARATEVPKYDSLSKKICFLFLVPVR